MKKKKILLSAFLLLTLITGFQHNGLAKNKQGGVIKLEVTTIEGRVQKPNAFFINTRQSLVYQSMEMKEHFIPKITSVVDSGDF
jgi:hypothetical protein